MTAATLTTLARLSTQHRKSAFLLGETVAKMAEVYGLEHLGFLTLTFAQHITCPKEARRRLNSLVRGVILDRYRAYLWVFERQKSGRVHYHLLIALDADIRTGCDFGEFDQGVYKSAGTALRSEWAFWRKTAKAYGFGRTELLPVKSSTEAISRYVGKYIGKHLEARKDEDKGVRLVGYSDACRVGTTRFQFISEGSRAWRRKLAIFAAVVQHHHPETRVAEISDLTRVLGKRWAHQYREYILALP